jgi:hypothetical protein
MLFFAVTAIAVWLGWNMHQIRQRELVRQFVSANGAGFIEGSPIRPWKQLPLTWRLLGVKPIRRIDAQGTFKNEDDREHISAAFPEADIHY